MLCIVAINTRTHARNLPAGCRQDFDDLLQACALPESRWQNMRIQRCLGES